MLEALDQIKAAEIQIAEKKQMMLADIKAYATQRNHELQQQQDQNQAELKKLIAEREALETTRLEEDKAGLLIEAKKISDELQEQYQKYDQAAIQRIIERVKTTYGSD